MPIAAETRASSKGLELHPVRRKRRIQDGAITAVAGLADCGQQRVRTSGRQEATRALPVRQKEEKEQTRAKKASGEADRGAARAGTSTAARRRTAARDF